MFSSLQEGFTELTKAVILTVIVYYGKGIQIKVSQGERGIGQGLEELQVRIFQLPLLSGVMQAVFTCHSNDAC